MEIGVSKFMEYEQLCKDIFEIDKQIRFAAVYNSKIEKVAGGIRKGVKTLIPESITELSVEQSYQMAYTNPDGRLDWIAKICFSRI